MKRAWQILSSAPLLLAAVRVGPAGAHTLTLEVDADTCLKEGAPNRNQGSEPVLRVRDAGNNRAVVRFTFPGRYGSIASGGAGRYVIAYDEGRSKEQDIHVVCFDSGGNVSWNTPVVRNPRGLERFKIAAASKGGYVVSGRVDLMPSAFSVTDGGAARRLLLANVEAALQTGVACGEAGCFVAYSTAVKDGGGVEGKVRLLPFKRGGP